MESGTSDDSFSDVPEARRPLLPGGRRRRYRRAEDREPLDLRRLGSRDCAQREPRRLLSGRGRERLSGKLESSARADLDGVFLVVAATSSREVNGTIFREAQQRNILCNVVDDPEYCDFYYPAVVQARRSSAGDFDQRPQPGAGPKNQARTGNSIRTGVWRMAGRAGKDPAATVCQRNEP